MLGWLGLLTGAIVYEGSIGDGSEGNGDNVAGDVPPGFVLIWGSRYFILSMNVSPCYFAVPVKGVVVATVNEYPRT